MLEFLSIEYQAFDNIGTPIAIFISMVCMLMLEKLLELKTLLHSICMVKICCSLQIRYSGYQSTILTCGKEHLYLKTDDFLDR